MRHNESDRKSLLRQQRALTAPRHGNPEAGGCPHPFASCFDATEESCPAEQFIVDNDDTASAAFKAASCLRLKICNGDCFGILRPHIEQARPRVLLWIRIVPLSIWRPIEHF